MAVIYFHIRNTQKQYGKSNRRGATMSWDRNTWSSWAGDFMLRPNRHYYPKNVTDIVDAVKAAETASPPQEVHAVGSGWAFSAPAATFGYLIETDKLNKTLHGLILASAKNAVAAQVQASGLFHVEAGIKLYDLCRRLDENQCLPPNDQQGRWALATLGGSTGQSLAGAISTGTHGADVRLPPLADCVRAIHLVGPGGIQHWIEGKDPIGNAQKLGVQYPGIVFHRDADLLRAAVLSLGAFGIIYSLVLEVVPQYGMIEIRSSTGWSECIEMLNDESFFKKHRSVQVVMEPYARNHHERVCYFTTRDETRSEPARREVIGKMLARSLGADGAIARPLTVAIGTTIPVLAGDLRKRRTQASVVAGLLLASLLALVPAANCRPGDIVGLACNWLNRVGLGGVTRRFVNAVLRYSLRPGSRTGVSYQIMAGPPWAETGMRGYSAEVFFDATNPRYLNSVGDLLDIFNAYALRGKSVVGWFSLRYMSSSSATLAMQQWPCTVSVEVALLRGVDGTAEFLGDFIECAIQRGATIHWGQTNPVDAAVIGRQYPLANWRAQMAKLTQGASANVFVNEFCRTHGLFA